MSEVIVSMFSHKNSPEEHFVNLLQLSHTIDSWGGELDEENNIS